MKVFLIILAVLVVIFALILSISAEFTIIFDNGWTTKIKVLFIERDIELTKLLSFLVAPDKAGREAAEKSKEKKKGKKKNEEPLPDAAVEEAAQEADNDKTIIIDEQPAEAADFKAENPVTVETPETNPEIEAEKKAGKKAEKPEKLNPIQKIIKEDGVVGIMLLVSNLLQTVNSAITTLIKGLHIYSLYVKMIIGGGDAATIGEKYGSICGWYYPLKGLILNQMKVDNYDDLIIPDFIAPRSEYELQFIGSISVGLLVKVGLKAGKVFLVNFIKNR